MVNIAGSVLGPLVVRLAQKGSVNRKTLSPRRKGSWRAEMPAKTAPTGTSGNRVRVGRQLWYRDQTNWRQ